MVGDDHTRREVLQATAAAVAGTAGTSTGPASAAEDPQDVVPTTRGEVREAFADVPWNDDPTERERESAKHRLPSFVVPDEGPIPNPQESIEIAVEAPPWLLASAYWKEAHYVRDGAFGLPYTGSESAALAVCDRFMGARQAVEQYVLPSGGDAVDAVVAALKEGDHREGQA